MNQSEKTPKSLSKLHPNLCPILYLVFPLEEPLADFIPPRLRQAAGNDNLGATLTQATQKDPATTNWVESTILGTTTWVQVLYTQTFASVVDQYTTAGAGSIGLGTHTGVVGVVKAANCGGSVMPTGSLFTVTMGAAGIFAGMGMMLF